MSPHRQRSDLPHHGSVSNAMAADVPTNSLEARKLKRKEQNRLAQRRHREKQRQELKRNSDDHSPTGTASTGSGHRSDQGRKSNSNGRRGTITGPSSSSKSSHSQSPSTTGSDAMDEDEDEEENGMDQAPSEEEKAQATSSSEASIATPPPPVSLHRSYDQQQPWMSKQQQSQEGQPGQYFPQTAQLQQQQQFMSFQPQQQAPNQFPGFTANPFAALGMMNSTAMPSPKYYPAPPAPPFHFDYSSLLMPAQLQNQLSQPQGLTPGNLTPSIFSHQNGSYSDQGPFGYFPLQNTSQHQQQQPGPFDQQGSHSSQSQFPGQQQQEQAHQEQQQQRNHHVQQEQQLQQQQQQQQSQHNDPLPQTQFQNLTPNGLLASMIFPQGQKNGDLGSYFPNMPDEQSSSRRSPFEQARDLNSTATNGSAGAKPQSLPSSSAPAAVVQASNGKANDNQADQGRNIAKATPNQVAVTTPGGSIKSAEAFNRFLTLVSLQVPWANRLLKPRWDLIRVLHTASDRLGIQRDYIETQTSVSFLPVDYLSSEIAARALEGLKDDNDGSTSYSNAISAAAGSKAGRRSRDVDGTRKGVEQGMQLDSASSMGPVLRWVGVPANMRPSSLAGVVPHHPFIDLSFPWPEVRDRILVCISSGLFNDIQLCMDVWPGEGEHQSLDEDPPYWIHGDDPFDPEAYEVSPRFINRYPWLFDEAILKRSNWWRRQQEKDEFFAEARGLIASTEGLSQWFKDQRAHLLEPQKSAGRPVPMILRQMVAERGLGHPGTSNSGASATEPSATITPLSPTTAGSSSNGNNSPSAANLSQQQQPARASAHLSSHLMPSGLPIAPGPKVEHYLGEELSMARRSFIGDDELRYSIGNMAKGEDAVAVGALEESARMFLNA